MVESAKVMAVDLGASGGKCFVGKFSPGRLSVHELHRFSYEPVVRHLPDRGGNLTSRLHWDDLYIHQNIIEGLRLFRREAGDRLDAAGIDTWGTDGMFMSPDGEPLGGVYAYRDHRLDGMTGEVKQLVDPEKLYAITGIHFQPFNLSNQLLWFVRNRPGLLVPGSFFLPVPSLFHYYLGGERMVDSSWASVTQLMDSREKRWSSRILNALGIEESLLPPIVRPGSPAGRLSGPVAAETGLNRAPLIAVASHDTASAFAAAPVEDASQALIISSGTWSLLGKLIAEPITGAEAMQANISNEGGIGNIRFLKNCSGSWITQELRRVWRDEDGVETSWRELDRLTEAAQPFRAFIDPDDASFYNPDNMRQAVCDYCARTGQEAPGDRGAMLRMVYESLALKYRLVDRQLSAACRQPTRVIHIVGGGSRNHLLNQFTANATGLPVVAGPDEATAIGNLVTQSLGLGLISRIEEAIPMIREACEIRDYQPENQEAWREAISRFSKLVRGYCPVR